MKMRRNAKEKTGRFTGRRTCHVALFCGIALTSLAAAGCSRSERSSDERAGGANTSPAKAAATPRRGESADPKHPVVEIATSAGPIRVKLDAENSPSTVRNFLNYASEGFYNDTLIHYVDADKMIIGGGYSVDLQPKPAGATIRNEAHNGLKNLRGTIAMARDSAAGIDNATSQFFINLVDTPSFDHRGEEASEYGFCVFGEVVDGLDVADGISRSETRDQGGDLARTPVPPVVVKSINVVE